MALKKVNKMFGVEEKEEWEHEKNLKPWEMGERLGAFRSYLKTDCLSLAHSLFGLCEILGYTFGVTPSISLSTTSAKVFDKCFYDLDGIHPNEEYEEFIRKAIYGGRNEVYSRYGEKINLYDVRSMYVSCYDTPIPIGRMRWVRPNIDVGTLAEASVKVPRDKYIGPLPYRIRGKLLFPVGEFEGWWDVGELRNATKEGTDVTIRRQLYCEEEPVLKSFGEVVSKLRTGRQSAYWKMFGLSLSGKLGQSRWRDVVRHISEISNLEGYTPMDRDEVYFQTKEYMGGKTPYVRPAVAMRIRSEARIRHLKIILEALEGGKIFYGDTDSIFTTTKLPVGEAVGELTYLGRAERGYFIRQKLYGLIKQKTLVQRSAGFSDLRLTEGDFTHLLNGEELLVDVNDLPSYRHILKEKEVELLLKRRAIRSDEVGDNRIHIGRETEPICLP